MSAPRPHASRRNRRLALAMTGAVFAMLGMSYAAVPLYEMFCAATGYGGTPKVAAAAPDHLGTRQMRVRFDANVRGGLPLSFEGEVASVAIVPGETKTIFYKVTNRSDRAVAAIASYNVTPDAAGGWFSKISCFCFTEQTIPAGAAMDLPVVFFLDPGLEKDATMAGVTDVTLSYTFYPVEPSKQQDKRVEGPSGQTRGDPAARSAGASGRG
jgi:cytochrome c oxidase assembly protein subunit 11